MNPYCQTCHGKPEAKLEEMLSQHNIPLKNFLDKISKEDQDKYKANATKKTTEQQVVFSGNTASFKLSTNSNQNSSIADIRKTDFVEKFHVLRREHTKVRPETEDLKKIEQEIFLRAENYFKKRELAKTLPYNWNETSQEWFMTMTEGPDTLFLMAYNFLRLEPKEENFKNIEDRIKYLIITQKIHKKTDGSTSEEYEALLPMIVEKLNMPDNTAIDYLNSLIKEEIQISKGKEETKKIMSIGNLIQEREESPKKRIKITTTTQAKDPTTKSNLLERER